MSDLTPSREIPSEKIPGDGRPLIQIGQWYWVKTEESKKQDWFACVIEIGSNYIKVESPNGSYDRIHENDFEKVAKLEENPDKVIQGQIDLYKKEVQGKLGQIKEITARLGIQPRENTKAPKSESRELSTFNAMPDLKKYKKELIQAKEKTLPKLFEEVEKGHERMAMWMAARAVPMKAMCGGLREAIEQINDRVFNVSLYAGLTEEVEKIADGKPAEIYEKLRLFQRMCFMDEECLVNYRHGGMEFHNIGEFDEWILEKENRDRILPWPRCMVAFRVRRERKERYYDGSYSCAMMNFHLEQADKTTFMYIRNGEQLYRMTCDFEFDEHIFPSQHQVDFTEPMMAEERIDSVGKIITKRHYDEMCKEWDEGVKNCEKWQKEHEHLDRMNQPHNPFYRFEWSHDHPREKYQPFDKSSVYFDDMEEKIAKQLKYYNRIALIVQGLFDRSEILHPHKPARLWAPGGMEEVVELVYDGAGAIHYKEPPDFEEYWKQVNKAIGKGSFTIGQEDAWERREAQIENNRWNSRQKNMEKYQPYGDPGPGYIAEILEWQKKSGNAIFRWTRERRTWGYRYGAKDVIPCVIRVHGSKLFNVSGYKPGDYKQFYIDPRSREKYLKWAPLLLAAEEWHAGNLDKEGKLKKKKNG